MVIALSIVILNWGGFFDVIALPQYLYWVSVVVSLMIICTGWLVVEKPHEAEKKASTIGTVSYIVVVVFANILYWWGGFYS